MTGTPGSVYEVNWKRSVKYVSRHFIENERTCSKLLARLSSDLQMLLIEGCYYKKLLILLGRLIRAKRKRNKIIIYAK